jgi:hypothetical protein
MKSGKIVSSRSFARWNKPGWGELTYFKFNKKTPLSPPR